MKQSHFCKFCKTNHKYKANICCSCKKINIEYYMLKHMIWKKITTEESYLCFSCVQERLKRNIRKTVFLKCPLNVIKEYINMNDYTFSSKEIKTIKEIVDGGYYK